LKILADENIHTQIVQGIKDKGIEVVSAREAGLTGKTDDVILEYSEKNDMVLMTGDKDFGGLIEFGTLWGRGKVILFRYRLINVGKTIKDTVSIIHQEQDILKKKFPVVIVLSEAGYRIHRPGQ